MTTNPLLRKQPALVLLFILLCLFCSLLVFTGCSHMMAAESKTGEKALRQRVNDLWTAKQNSDWTVAYSFYCKAYQRARTADQYVRGSNLNISGFSIDHIEIDKAAQKAVVTTKFQTKVMGFDLGGVPVKETWLIEGGRWYVCPEKIGAKFMLQ